jgi:hypothetical protein
LRTWVIHQHQTSGLEWESAFLRAVAKRVADVKPGRLFLPLSSGYDSGAIHLALVLLDVPHDTYSIVGVESKREVDLMRQASRVCSTACRERLLSQQREAHNAVCQGAAGGVAQTQLYV